MQNTNTQKLKIFSFLVTSLVMLFSMPARIVSAEPIRISEPTQEMIFEIKAMDKRSLILRDYLAKFNSPLTDSAIDFVNAADRYSVDWKLVAAISGVESTFGKRTPGSDQYPSYNGWGWGVYGTQAIYFKSWKEAIYTITEGLKKNYIDKGYVDPYQMNKKYAASPAWGWKVDFFMREIQKFADKYDLEADASASEIIKVQNGSDQIVSGASAKLALVAN